MTNSIETVSAKIANLKSFIPKFEKAIEFATGEKEQQLRKNLNRVFKEIRDLSVKKRQLRGIQA